jgi:hypothetical protein
MSWTGAMSIDGPLYEYDMIHESSDGLTRASRGTTVNLYPCGKFSLKPKTIFGDPHSNAVQGSKISRDASAGTLNCVLSFVAGEHNYYAVGAQLNSYLVLGSLTASDHVELHSG